MNNQRPNTVRAAEIATVERSREKAMPSVPNEEAVYEMAATSAVRDNCRAVLTLQALEHSAFLSAAEAYYAQIAPNGSEEYRKIVQAYAYRAVMEIMDGGEK